MAFINSMMILAYSFCNVTLMPIRSEPTHKSEQISQLLYGERAEIQQVNNSEWAKIKCANDGYEGWCKVAQLTMITYKEYKKTIKYISYSNFNALLLNNYKLYLPLGCELTYLKKLNTEFKLIKFNGKKIDISKTIFKVDDVINAATNYMNAPYLWGGRSVTGIDCSGLTQMAYKLCNFSLPRDASQQANIGVLVDFLQSSICGDLAFFDDKDGKIVHVGILIDNQTIIHASDTAGKVTIDKIDQGGIISTKQKKRTHKLRFVKRIFN